MITFLLTCTVYVSRGLAVAKVWPWFAQPVLGFPMTASMAVGLSFTWTLFQSTMTTQQYVDMDGHKKRDVYGSLLANVIAHWLIVAVSFVIYRLWVAP